MIKCVIFDMDGTLANTLPLCITSFRKSIEKLSGKILTDREIINTFGVSEEGIIKKLLPESYKEGLALYLQYYKDLHRQMCPEPFSGIKEFLQWLKEQGIFVALVTGKGEKSLDISLQELGLAEYFAQIKYGNEQGTDKSVYIKQIISDFSLSKQDVIYVGDTVSDIMSSRRAGVSAVAAAWAETADLEKLENAMPTYLARSIQDLQCWIEKENEVRNTVNSVNKADLKIIANARKLTREYYLTDYDDTENRRRILTALFGKIGNNVAIDTPFHCNYGKNIYIGDNVIINMNCTFVDDAKIIIGNSVLIASNVQIYTSSHSTDPNERMIKNWREKNANWFSTYSEPIIIQDGVWIGGGAIILPNVVIGKNSVIGAGSVVNRSIPDNCVAVGNPCRPIRYFNQ